MKQFLIILLSTILIYGCGKDCKDPTNPDCSNYNPCLSKPETSADFYTEVQEGNRWYEVDVADEIATWRFRAKDSTADEYLWEVGADKFTTKSFTLSGFPIYRYIPIKLTIKRYKPNTQCFPNDKGVATMTKNIYTESITNFEYDYKTGAGPKNTTLKTIYGKFKGYNKRNPNHIFDFELKPQCCRYQTDFVLNYIGNLDKFYLPYFDIVNIPYEGQSVYKTFLENDTFFNLIYDYEVENINLKDGRSYGLLESTHLSFGVADELYGRKFYNTSTLVKNYGFFKSYIYLDRNNKDKITVEYWYRDTTSRKLLKDTFIGTRVP